MSSYGIGTLARLSIEIRDAVGQLTDPVSLWLGIRLPDGAMAGPFDSGSDPAVAKDGTGLYHLDYPTVQPGPHIAHWSSTSPTVTNEQQFDVEAQWSEVGIVSLQDVKIHLKKRVTDTADDEKLQGMILSATDLIEDRVGHVMPKLITEEVYSRGHIVVLKERPVVKVVSVTRLSTMGELAEHNPATGVNGWKLTSPEGILESYHRFPGDIQLVYRVGRVPTPHRYRLACKELVAHLWRTTQLNADGGRPPLQGDVQVSPSSSFALPYNVRQLLGLDKSTRDMPTIG